MQELAFCEIDSIEEIESSEPVYDIELEKIHYFSANNIVSHNCRLRSNTDNKFFTKQELYKITLDDSTVEELKSTDTLLVQQENGVTEALFPDEIKKNKDLYIYNGHKITSIEVTEEKTLNQDREYSNSFGSGSTKIGSIGVATINLPRLGYKHIGDEELFFEDLKNTAEDCCRVNHAKRHVIQKRIDSGSAPLYKFGFIDLKKQYSTTGIVGLKECLDIMGYNILEENGQQFVSKILDVLNNVCERFERFTKCPHNLEQIPAESAAVKLAEKDKLLKYQTGDFSYSFYSNQFIPLIANADLLDRIRLQGLFDSQFSGGAILHINVSEKVTDAKQIENLISLAAEQGVVYFAINYAIKECEDGHIMVKEGHTCDCGKEFVNEYSRPVGYITCTKLWSKTKREDDYANRKFYTSVKVA